MVEHAGVWRGPAATAASHTLQNVMPRAGLRDDPVPKATFLPHTLDAAAARFGAHPAIEFMGKTISYREFGALVDRAAKGLQGCGVGPGVHVGLLLPNTPHFPIAFFAVLKAGGTVVSHSPHDADELLALKIDESGTDLLITLDTPTLFKRADRLLGTTRLRRLVIGNLAQFAAEPDTVGVRHARAGLRVGFVDDERHLSFGRLLRSDGGVHPPAHLDPQASVALLHYAGGADAKRAMLTHAELAAAVERLASHLTHGHAAPLHEGSERVLVRAPLCHVLSLTVNLLLAVRLGASMLLREGDADAHTMPLDHGARRPAVLAGEPAADSPFVDALRSAPPEPMAPASCACGGELPHAEPPRGFRALTGRRIEELWRLAGLSELDDPLEHGVDGWGLVAAHTRRGAAASK